MGVGGGVEGSDDSGFDVVPVESAVAAANRWDGDGGDVEGVDLCDEVEEARVDVFESALAAPVAFGGEVDDVLC